MDKMFVVRLKGGCGLEAAVSPWASELADLCGGGAADGIPAAGEVIKYWHIAGVQLSPVSFSFKPLSYKESLVIDGKPCLLLEARCSEYVVSRTHGRSCPLIGISCL